MKERIGAVLVILSIVTFIYVAFSFAYDYEVIQIGDDIIVKESPTRDYD